MTRVALALVSLLVLATDVAAQRATGAVVPNTITVGDVFHAAVRLELPPGADVVAPDSLPLPEDLEHAGRRELRVDTAAGMRRVTVVYPLAAWRPGEYTLPAIPLRVLTPAGEQRLEASLPPFTVSSVLPADTTGIEMRAAKDVLGADRIWWPWLLLAALILAALLAWLWWRRRRRGATVEEPPVPAVPPREVALERLEALRRSGLAERGEWKVFYAELSETLRRYASSVEPEWSVDLTTSELAHRVRARRDAGVLELIRLLGGADLVKFAKAVPAHGHALADLDAARLWVERTSPPEPEAVAEPGSEEVRVA